MKRVSFIRRSNGSHWVGDGFPVQSIFSYNDIAAQISPFLLMDHAGPRLFPPTTRKLGVGQHPHRGFETVTIVYDGGVSHRDSSGGGGTIGPGDVQWMTAGAGLIHEEYHSTDFAAAGGLFEMIQLWVNLPARHKMTPPTYQGIPAAGIPVVNLPAQAGRVRVIAGQYDGVNGAARTFTPINLWDLRLKAGHTVTLHVPPGHTTALYVLRGGLRFGGEQPAGAAELVVLETAGSQVAFEVTADSTVLLLGGAPLGEAIVGHGPFVMNTREEIAQAIDDFNRGRFGQIAT